MRGNGSGNGWGLGQGREIVRNYSGLCGADVVYYRLQIGKGKAKHRLSQPRQVRLRQSEVEISFALLTGNGDCFAGDCFAPKVCAARMAALRPAHDHDIVI